MKDVFVEIKSFFDQEGIKYSPSSDYPDTLHFRACGTRYSLRTTDKGIIFCLEAYTSTEKLIEAINKECRGGDGTFGS